MLLCFELALWQILISYFVLNSHLCITYQESRKLTVPVRNSGEQHTSAAACDDREVLTARQTLETMLSSVPHDLLIRELLVLQAGVPQHAQVSQELLLISHNDLLFSI